MVGENKLINIEMNKNYYKGLIHKNFHYLQKLGSIQYESGESYKEDKLLYQINFDNYHRFKNHRLLTICMFQDMDTGEIENENIIIYHIDLEYLREVCYNKNVENLDELEKICMLIITESRKIAENISKGDRIMEEVTKKLTQMQKNVFADAIYDGVEQDERIRKAMIETAEEEATERGLETGMKQGIYNKEREIARNMLKENINLALIQTVTGLSVEEINALETQ